MDYNKTGEYDKAISILKPMGGIMSNSEAYLAAYGMSLHAQKKYKAALKKFNKAAEITTNPELYLKMSYSYMMLGDAKSAIEKCSLAVNMVPNRIAPKYALMNIYTSQRDTINALKIAKEIVVQTPKGISKDAAFYKKKAQSLIDFAESRF